MLRLIFGETLKIVAPTLAAILILYIVASHLDRGTDTVSLLDVVDAPKSILSVEPAYAMFKSNLLAGEGTAVMLIGPSNVTVGFRPSEIAALMPGISVHNLSFGGANIDGMAAAVDLIYSQRVGKQRSKTIFVVGLWFGEFLHNESNPASTPLGQQMLRFGMFRYDSDGFTLQVSHERLDLIFALLRPIFAVQKLVGSQSQLAQNLAGHMPSVGSATPSQRQNLESSVPTAQFDVLLDIADKIRKQGGALVLADMPLPRRFTNRDPRWAEYQHIKRPYIQAMVERGAVYVDMQDMDDDGDFKDDTHPVFAATRKWAARLVLGIENGGLVQ